MENEVWKSVIGFEGLYEVSDKGRIKSLKRKVNNRTNEVAEKIMKLTITQNGYLKVVLNNQKPTTKLVHRIVGEAFIPNPENKRCINHIDCNRQNNNIENLEWATHSENNSYPFLLGYRTTNLVVKYGHEHPKSKLTKEQVNDIKMKYKPYEYSISNLCKEYNVSPQTIRRILTGKSYKNA